MARLHRAVRKEQILAAAIELAETHGYDKITRKQIAEAAWVAEGSVSLHWGTMEQFRRSIMRHAVKCNNVTIVAQGLCTRHPAVEKAPQELRERAARSLA